MNNPQKTIILDANILIRAVLGTKVGSILTLYQNVKFVSPEVCFVDTKKYIPPLIKNRSISMENAVKILNLLPKLVTSVSVDQYEEYEEKAKQRIRSRDLADWPVIAAALTLNSPIWTEDQDFFGTGIATWTTDRVHLFFKDG